MKRRPTLTPETVAKRLQWALDYVDWTLEQWCEIIFSDECSLERGAGGQREWAFRTPAQKWDKIMIEPYKKGKDICIMIWGAIWIGGRSDVIMMVRDENSPKKGYSRFSYLDVLEEAIPTCWQPGQIFMQDNAPIHTAQVVKEYFESEGIPLLPWPPYSPDLNPIEHLWHLIKTWLQKNRPDLCHGGKSEEDRAALGRAIVEAWDAIPQESIDGLIRSMGKRCKAVIKAEGWHTKY
jgi:DDE superfamily endonuclease